jgi:hypothetical protein
MHLFCDDPSGNNAASLLKYSYHSLIRGNGSRFSDTTLPILRPGYPGTFLSGDYPHWLRGTMQIIHSCRDDVPRSIHESPDYKNYFSLPVYMRIAVGYDSVILLFCRKLLSMPHRDQRVPLQSFLPALYNPLIRATGSHPLPSLQS